MQQGNSSPKVAAQTSTLADLTAAARRTTGERPPPLVGCSLTLINDHIYLFGGRLVPTRTMVSTLYSLSLRSLEWRLLWPPAEPSISDEAPPTGPAPRYFHSAEAWGSKIVIFGGEGYAETESGAAEAEGDEEEQAPLCTLGDLCIWDTETGKWEFPEAECDEGVEPPAPRYAHLAAVSSVVGEGGKEQSVMLLMGGQDIRNIYLQSMNVLDLNLLRWVKSSQWTKSTGTYRAVATTSKWSVVPGGPLPSATSRSGTNGGRPRGESVSSVGGRSMGSAATYVMDEKKKDEIRKGLVSGGDEAALGLPKGETLVQLSYSVKPSAENPEPLLLFSNFNFTQVRRDLDLISAPVHPTHSLDATSLSALMSGLTLPPGLRFPTGTIIGRYLLIFGTFLSHAVNNFSIWALDLGESGSVGVLAKAQEKEPLNWMRIDPGSVLSQGSWNRALGWNNSAVVLGGRERDIATDYDHRQTNFAHVAFIDLEAFGVYQPPTQPLPPVAQSFGLLTLSQPFLADFEICCSDGVRLGCSRKLLEDRWTWFRVRLADFKLRAKGMLTAQQKRIDAQAEAGDSESVADDTPPTPVAATPTANNVDKSPTASSEFSNEIRLTPRTLNLPEASPVVQAFLQYLYTLTLCTPHQFDLPVLTSLLVFAKSYEESNLRALCVHALHETLNSGQWSAAQVYEASTLGGCTALQIRALRILMGGPRNKLRSTPPEPPFSTVHDEVSSETTTTAHSTTTSASAQGAAGKAIGLPVRRPSPSTSGGRTRAASTPAPSFATRAASATSPPSPSPSRPSTPQRRRPSLPTASTYDPLSSPRLVPVPRWSLFPPPSLTPVPASPPPSEPLRRSLSIRSQSTASTTGAIINSYAHPAPPPEAIASDEETDMFGSPRSISTFATSMSRSSSAGTSFTSPAMKQGSMLGIAVEEEEEDTESSYVLLPPSSMHLPLPLSSPSLREEDERRGRRLSWTSRRSKGSTSTKSSGTGTARVTAVAKVEEARSFWTPQEGDGSTRVKTNRATRVDESLVAELLHPITAGENLSSSSIIDFNPAPSPAPSQSTFADPHSPSPSASSFSHHPMPSTSTISLHSHHTSTSPGAHHSSPSVSHFPLQIPKDKSARQAFERELGIRVLRASGASEREISLRARSVGFQILKEEERKEAEAKKEGRQYTGGLELRSQFSWT